MPKRHPFDEAYSTGIDRAVPPSQRRQLTGPRSTQPTTPATTRAAPRRAALARAPAAPDGAARPRGR